MSEIVKCSNCHKIFTRREFNEHECHIPWKTSKEIPILYYLVLDKIEEKQVLGVGLDGTHYFFVVKKPQAIPFIRGIFPSDESKRHKDSDGEVTEPAFSPRFKPRIF